MDKLSGYWPAWIAILVATIVLLNQAITESKKFASFLGKVGLWWYERSRRRYQMDQIEFNNAVRNAVSDERKKWEDDEARALNTIKEQMVFITELSTEQQKKLNDFSFQLRCMTAYVEYEADWHHQFRMHILKSEGLIAIADLPEHMHYEDFESKCRELGNVSWRSWSTKK